MLVCVLIGIMFHFPLNENRHPRDAESFPGTGEFFFSPSSSFRVFQVLITHVLHASCSIYFEASPLFCCYKQGFPCQHMLCMKAVGLNLPTLILAGPWSGPKQVIGLGPERPQACDISSPYPMFCLLE